MIGTDSDEPMLLVIKRLRDHRVVEILSLGGGTLEGHEFSTLDEMAREKGCYISLDEARECGSMESLIQHFEEMSEQVFIKG